MSDGFKAFSAFGNPITVAHPYLQLFRTILENGIPGGIDMKCRVAIFTFSGGDDFSACGLTGDLHPIADAKNRNREVENGGIQFWCTLIVNSAWAPTEDDPMNTATVQFFCSGGAGKNLAVNTVLPDPAGDQLTVLRSEIEDRTELIITL